jgi:hypothetical protein
MIYYETRMSNEADVTCVYRIYWRQILKFVFGRIGKWLEMVNSVLFAFVLIELL